VRWQSVKAVVLSSAKPNSWIAGADIKAIDQIKSAEEATKLVREGQLVMNSVADMQKKKPWVAAIDGACLGGGLEMAMTCSQRIATSNAKTVTSHRQTLASCVSPLVACRLPLAACRLPLAACRLPLVLLRATQPGRCSSKRLCAAWAESGRG
jgi:hypothetical protein